MGWEDLALRAQVLYLLALKCYDLLLGFLKISYLINVTIAKACNKITLLGNVNCDVFSK